MIKDLLERLSSYNVFNYLLPGVLFAAIGDKLSTYTLLHDDIVVALFVYYFYGLVISRLGSLIVEPLLKRSHFVRFAPYKDFVAASRVDTKIELLSETNNMYRTLCALFICLIGLRGIDDLFQYLSITPKNALVFGSIALFVLFAFAYRKQTAYITQRISKHLEESTNDTTKS